MYVDGYNFVMKTAGLVKEAISPMQVMNRLVKRRPTQQLARHFDTPDYVVPEGNMFGALGGKGKSREALGKMRSGTLGQAAREAPMSYKDIHGRIQQMKQQRPTTSVQDLRKRMDQVKMPSVDEFLNRPDISAGISDAVYQGTQPLRRDPPLSPMLADNPMSTAMRKQYPKAPNMAAQMEATENALKQQLGDRANELPVYLRRGMERTNYIPPSTERILQTVKDKPGTPGEVWDAAKGMFWQPQGSGHINLGINDPAILGHEGRHALQFLPKEGKGFRPGLQMGRPMAVPTESLTGKPRKELDELLEIERDANLAVPDLVPGLTEEQRALQGAAQSTYETLMNPELRSSVTGGFRRALPEKEQIANVLRRVRQGEDWESAALEEGIADRFSDQMRHLTGQGKWYDDPGTPPSLRERVMKEQELRKKVQSNFFDRRGETGDLAMKNPLHSVDPDVPRLRPMNEEVTPFDPQFWRHAARDPDTVSFQAQRHNAVVDQLRSALGDDYADAYDNWVTTQVGQVDKDDVFGSALQSFRNPKPEATLMDRLKSRVFGG